MPRKTEWFQFFLLGKQSTSSVSERLNWLNLGVGGQFRFINGGKTDSQTKKAWREKGIDDQNINALSI